MSNNTIILLGRLGKDPDVKYISAEKSVTNFNLAVTREGNKEVTDWFNCQAWDKTGLTIDKYCKKGSQVLIVGRLDTGSYEKDGVKHNKVTVTVKSFSFAGGKGDDKLSSNSSQSKHISDDFMDIENDNPPF